MRIYNLNSFCGIVEEMAKKVFIIHGWAESPDKDWFPWLKVSLEAGGFEVIVPAMPNPDEPKIEEWVSYLTNIAKEVDKNTYFVGHSIACQTILRYLEKSPEGTKIGGAVFVAPWITLTLDTEEEKRISKPWLRSPIDFEKVKKHCNKFIAIFSDNDPFVPLAENKKLFENNLGAKTVVENNKGHFTAENGVTELASALKALLEISV